MQLLPLHTGKLQATDSLVDALLRTGTFEDNDIIAISSKVVAYTEGAAIDLRTIEVSAEAIAWSEKLTSTKKIPAFRQAVLNETKRMNGRVLESCPMLMFCELAPAGMEGVILSVNAGLDMSNIDANFTIGWPVDPVASTKRIQAELQERTGKQLGIIITDSCCRPRRKGIEALALTAAGFNPITDEIGSCDLWGEPLTMTQEATADQLATAANFLMGNAAQAIPAVIIRDHGLPYSDFCGFVPSISAENDVFQGIV